MVIFHGEQLVITRYYMELAQVMSKYIQILWEMVSQ